MHGQAFRAATLAQRSFPTSRFAALLAALLVCVWPVPGPNGAARAGETRAYVVNEITVTDPAKFKVYAKHVPATLAPFGGTFIVRGGDPLLLSGAAIAKRVVILAFPSRAQALAWHDSPAYKKIETIRDASSRSRVYVVDAAGP